MRFSVIVPIYKTEPYLRYCVESVLSQSFDDFEVILVDDGSPDSCGEICDEFAKEHGNVTVVHKENGGLVSARKAGLMKAQGEYIINVDSDDWIERDFLLNADKIIKEHNPDIISFAVKYVYDNAKIEKKADIVAPGFYNREMIEKEIYPNMLLTPSMEHMNYYICAKVYKRDIYSVNQTAVDDRISMGEDVSVSVPCYLDAKSVFISDTVAYFVRCVSSSMSRKFNPNHYKDIELGVKRLREKGENAPASYLEGIDRYCAFMCFVLLASAAAANAKDKLDDVKTLWCDEFRASLDRARFANITKKSSIALKLIKKEKINSAFRFLRLCEMIKGAR